MDVDDIGSQRLHHIVPKPETFDRRCADIVDENVGVGDQLPRRRVILGRLQVQNHRTLATVERQVPGAHAARVGRLAGIAENVAAGGFDLGHIGAEIGENLRAIRTKNDAGQIDHADAFKHGCVRCHGVLGRALPDLCANCGEGKSGPATKWPDQKLTPVRRAPMELWTNERVARGG